MKIGYWGIVAVLAIVHLHALLQIVALEVPVYVPSILILIFTYFLYRNLFFSIFSLGKGWNGILFLFQFLLLIIYSVIKPSLVIIIIFSIFVGLELFRHVVSRKLYLLSSRLTELEKQSFHLNETFRVVRSERHDFLKHVSAIHFILENGHNEEGKKYLEKLVGGYKETNLSIKGEKAVVAGTLHSFFQQGKESGIEVVYDLDVPVSSLPLEDKDLVALIGNLLSNSFDAAKAWQEETNKKAVITVQFFKKSGLYLLICKNNSLPIANNILDHLFVTFGKTSKAKGQGLGTKIINEIVNRHQGLLDFTFKEQEFTVKIKFPAIKKELN